MPVVHPPRRTAFRTAAVALAATVAVGAALAIPAQAASTLKDLATAAGKDIGFALAPDRLSESAYKSVADSEFTLVVPENAMKWDATEPSQNSFSYGGGDQVVSYAAPTGKKLYGHTLVWHSPTARLGQRPVRDGPAVRDDQPHHQRRGRFKGKVAAWDVVNEAFDDNGARRDDSPFQQKLGDGYIETAFRTARAADPAAKLCINDYNTDGINAKSTAIYNLVKDFKARGVPIDCVGFQAHLIVGQVPGDLQPNLQRFADLGVDVRITELDIRMTTPADATKLANQAADYKRVFQVCLAVARCAGRDHLGHHRQVLLGAGHVPRPGRGPGLGRQLRAEAGVRRHRRRVRRGPAGDPHSDAHGDADRHPDGHADADGHPDHASAERRLPGHLQREPVEHRLHGERDREEHLVDRAQRLDAEVHLPVGAGDHAGVELGGQPVRLGGDPDQRGLERLDPARRQPADRVQRLAHRHQHGAELVHAQRDHLHEGLTRTGPDLHAEVRAARAACGYADAMTTEAAPRTTYLLVDGENIDATLGSSILGGRPTPQQRPRWERVLTFAQQTWNQPVKALFFLNASNGSLPMSFVQALLAIGFQPIPLSGESYEKVVDIGIKRTLEAISGRGGDVLLASHDGDFAPELEALVDDEDRRVGLLAFREFTSTRWPSWPAGSRRSTWRATSRRSTCQLPRLRIIPLDEFDPLRYL